MGAGKSKPEIDDNSTPKSNYDPNFAARFQSPSNLSANPVSSGGMNPNNPVDVWCEILRKESDRIIGKSVESVENAENVENAEKNEHFDAFKNNNIKINEEMLLIELFKLQCNPKPFNMPGSTFLQPKNDDNAERNKKEKTERSILGYIEKWNKQIDSQTERAEKDEKHNDKIITLETFHISPLQPQKSYLLNEPRFQYNLLDEYTSSGETVFTHAIKHRFSVEILSFLRRLDPGLLLKQSRQSNTSFMTYGPSPLIIAYTMQPIDLVLVEWCLQYQTPPFVVANVENNALHTIFEIGTYSGLELLLPYIAQYINNPIALPLETQKPNLDEFEKELNFVNLKGVTQILGETKSEERSEIEKINMSRKDRQVIQKNNKIVGTGNFFTAAAAATTTSSNNHNNTDSFNNRANTYHKTSDFGHTKLERKIDVEKLVILPSLFKTNLNLNYELNSLKNLSNKILNLFQFINGSNLSSKTPVDILSEFPVPWVVYQLLAQYGCSFGNDLVPEKRDFETSSLMADNLTPLGFSTGFTRKSSFVNTQTALTYLNFQESNVAYLLSSGQLLFKGFFQPVRYQNLVKNYQSLYLFQTYKYFSFVEALCDHPHPFIAEYFRPYVPEWRYSKAECNTPGQITQRKQLFEYFCRYTLSQFGISFNYLEEIGAESTLPLLIDYWGWFLLGKKDGKKDQFFGQNILFELQLIFSLKKIFLLNTPKGLEFLKKKREEKGYEKLDDGNDDDNKLWDVMIPTDLNMMDKDSIEYLNFLPDIISKFEKNIGKKVIKIPPEMGSGDESFSDKSPRENMLNSLRNFNHSKHFKNKRSEKSEKSVLNLNQNSSSVLEEPKIMLSLVADFLNDAGLMGSKWELVHRCEIAQIRENNNKNNDKNPQTSFEEFELNFTKLMNFVIDGHNIDLNKLDKDGNYSVTDNGGLIEDNLIETNDAQNDAPNDPQNEENKRSNSTQLPPHILSRVPTNFYLLTMLNQRYSPSLGDYIKSEINEFNSITKRPQDFADSKKYETNYETNYRKNDLQKSWFFSSEKPFCHQRYQPLPLIPFSQQYLSTSGIIPHTSVHKHSLLQYLHDQHPYMALKEHYIDNNKNNEILKQNLQNLKKKSNFFSMSPPPIFSQDFLTNDRTPYKPVTGSQNQFLDLSELDRLSVFSSRVVFLNKNLIF
jgi:hypothetical protein